MQSFYPKQRKKERLNISLDDTTLKGKEVQHIHKVYKITIKEMNKTKHDTILQ